MNDHTKTKAQLIEEIELLRKRNEELTAYHDDHEIPKVIFEYDHNMLMDQLPIMIYIKGLDDRFLHANKFMANSFGVTKKEMIGKTEDDLNIDSNLKILYKEDKAVLSTGKPVLRMEKKVTDEQGNTKWFVVEKMPINDHAGKQSGMVGIIVDITDKILASKVLKEREASLEMFIKSARESIIVMDTESNVILLNNSAVAFLEHDADYYTGKTVWEIFPPYYADYLNENIQAIAQTKKGTIVEVILPFNGKMNYFMTSYQPMINDEGEVVSIFVLATDITERKKAETALRKSEEKYRNLTQSTHDILFSFNINGEVTYIGPQVSRYGYEPEEVISRPFLDFVHPDDRDRIKYETELTFAEGKEMPSEFRAIDKDGNTYWFEERGVLQKDEDGNFTGSTGVLRDITERKLLEDELAKASKLESIGILAGGIAHDFNNILAAILGNVSLVKLETDNNSENYDLLTEAENAITQATKLTHQLLTFAKGGSPVKEVIDIGELITETTKFNLRGTNIKYRLKIPTDLWTAEVDRGQVGQVIGNIVINAKQAMPDGGSISVTAKNTVLNGKKGVPLKPGNYICISISDKGIGIPAEQLNKIFDPYFTTKKTGTGIGLATAYSIVRRHNGHIEVESQEGKGTKFTLYFPSSSKKQVYALEEKVLTHSKLTGKILMMDDDPSIQKVSGMMLKTLGHTVTAVWDGSEAIKEYKQAKEAGEPFDVVIMDITIPGGMGGVETIAELRDFDPDVVAIVSSGYSNDPVIAEFLSYGFKGFIPKPYKFEDLKKALNNLLHEIK